MVGEHSARRIPGKQTEARVVERFEAFRAFLPGRSRSGARFSWAVCVVPMVVIGAVGAWALRPPGALRRTPVAAAAPPLAGAAEVEVKSQVGGRVAAWFVREGEIV